MTSQSVPKASEKLLRQLQQAALGTLRVINDEPLDSETHLLRIIMSDDSSITIAHKSYPDGARTLPLDGGGALGVYTERLVSTMFMAHAHFPKMTIGEVYEVASDYLLSTQASQTPVLHVVILDLEF